VPWEYWLRWLEGRREREMGKENIADVKRVKSRLVRMG
jgi:hypothetical protein